MAGRRGETWNDEDIAVLREMSRAGVELPAIAGRLERTKEAVATKARALDIMIVPPKRRRLPARR